MSGFTLATMLLKEYRICMPLTVAEYRIAQLYMIQKKSREESTGRGSGVEILKNEPYENGPGGKGQYTFKIYHVGSHLPTWIRNILPSSALRVEEEAWNAYPYTRTIYKVPFVEKLVLDIETYFYDDAGEQDDVFELSPDEKKTRIVDFIDIVKDPVTGSDYKEEEDPSTYVSEATGRGPLSPNWREEFSHAQRVTHEAYERPPTRAHDNSPVIGNLEPLPKRIMCAYKLCRVEFRYWGTQTRVEQFIHDTALRKTMVRAHRQVWAWQDEWYGLTIDEIRRLEEETAQALASKMADLNNSSNNAVNQLSNEAQVPTKPSDNTPVNNVAQSTCNQSVEELEANSVTTVLEEPRITCNTTDIEGVNINGNVQVFIYSHYWYNIIIVFVEQNLWADFKKLEANNFELDDFEPFTAPYLESDDDTRSFITCCSNLTDNTDYSTPLGSNFQSFDAPGILSCFSQKPVSGTQLNRSKLVLILVIHGGCVLDSTYDLTTKRSDILTFRKTIETVTANHYPTLHNRIAVKLVPCPTEIGDLFRLFSKLKAPPDPNRPVEAQLLRDFIPLGSIPIFLINSPGYSRMLEQLAFNLNTHYAEFLRSSEGINFSGKVCIVADSVGSILAHDLLSTKPLTDHRSMISSNNDNSSVTDIGLMRRKRLNFHCTTEMEKQLNSPTLINSPSEITLCPPESNPGVVNIESSNVENRESQSYSRVYALDFQSALFVSGTLVFRLEHLYLAGSNLRLKIKLSVYQAYNLFHLTDPYGFRIEPLLDNRFSYISPIFIPQYARYPLGDGQSTNLIETLVQQAELFSSDASEKSFYLPDSDNAKTIENDDITLNVKRQLTDHQLNWEKKSIIALEALKKVQQSWWGPKRVDYNVHCPEAIQSILARARPSILHASYWESKDVASFVIRQLLETLGLSVLETSYSADMSDEIAVTELAKVSLNPNQIKSQTYELLDDASTQMSQQSFKSGSNSYQSKFSTFSHSLSLGPRSFLKRTSSERLKNFKPNHRANDVITATGSAPLITGRFVFGGLDLMSFSGEKIRVEIQSISGTWAYVCTEVTDSSGRIRFFLPEQLHLPDGLYPIRMTAESDPDHPVIITLAIVPAQTEVVVFSVDGSFAASLSLMGKDPKVHPGAVDVARHWQGLGYLLIYLSARPDMQRRRVTNWMANHNFPFGMTFFLNGLYTDPLKQKAQMLKTIIENASLRIHCGYGSGKDINLYRSLGLSTHNIFLVGKVSRSQSSNGTPLTQGYSSHLSSLLNGHPLSRPAIGAVSVAVRCCPFDLPSIYPSSPLLIESSLLRNNSLKFSPQLNQRLLCNDEFEQNTL
ncbi:Protein retinal degeneration B [Schistosoma japonicum]|nr:Protein retinal degeneration B [Schistosoma japonicum]